MDFCRFCLPVIPSPFSGNRQACLLWELFVLYRVGLLNQVPTTAPLGS